MNIFAGIVRCDVICLGLIKGMAILGMKKPIILRLKGNNSDAVYCICIFISINCHF